MSTDTKIKTLIFNKLTQEQYNNADRVPTEFYLTPDTSIDSSEKGAANGVASLDTNGKVLTEQIPVATTSTLGGVKPDGTTIIVKADGTASATGGSTTAGRPLGEVYFSQSSLTTDNPGALPGWTGEYYENGKTLFPDLYNFVKAHSELQVTKAQYDSAIATYGECPKYVVDENTAQTSLRLPKYSRSHGAVIKAKKPTGTDHSWYRLYSDGWLEQGGRTEKVADYGTATITLPLQFLDTHYIVTYGNWRTGTTDDGTWNNSAILNDSTKSTTSFQIYSRGNIDGGKIYTWYSCGQGADGSQENTLYPWISAYTSAIPASVAQSTEFTGALAGKANTDLSNVSANIDYVVEYKNPTESDPSWFTKWKSGRLEQGGQIANLPTGNNIIYNLLKPFANNNYTLFAQICEVVTWSGDSSVSIAIGTRTTTTFGLSRRFRNIGDGDTIHVLWAARGQGVN